MNNGFDFKINSGALSSDSAANTKVSRLKQILYRPEGVLIFGMFAVFASMAVAKMGLMGGIILIALLAGSPMLLSALFNLKLGVILIIISSFVVLGIKRFSDDIPLGLGMDIIIAVMLFGLFVRQVNERDWSFAKNPISKAILAWILYNLLEFANPSAESRVAWLYTIRGTAGYMVLYFILIYVLDSRKYLKAILAVWIIMALLGAMHGFVQEHLGFLPFENQWIMSDIRRYRLLFIWGQFRKFSFFSDPMVFGFVMAYSSLLCITLSNAPVNKYIKYFLRVSAGLMIVAMIYSGTRAAYAILPAGLVLYAILANNKRIIAAISILIFLGTVVVFMPSGNTNIVRFQSAFKPNDDDSYKVRKRNQAYIQPYIQTHPLGGGLGSTGVWGERFSPNSPLAKFPPDSGFIRIAVEMGSAGLLLYCIFLYTIFHVGIRDFLILRDPKLKAVALAMLVVLYSLLLGNFPQEAINQYPTSILFFTAIAIINKLKFIEQKG